MDTSGSLSNSCGCRHGRTCDRTECPEAGQKVAGKSGTSSPRRPRRCSCTNVAHDGNGADRIADKRVAST